MLTADLVADWLRHLIGGALVRRGHVEQVLAIGSIADALSVFGELGCAAAVFGGAVAAQRAVFLTAVAVSFSSGNGEPLN